MTTPFPLYDYLVKEAVRSPSSSELKHYCLTITSLADMLPREQCELHYKTIEALILHHELLKYNGVLISNVPYEGKLSCKKGGIIYSVSSLPIDLQRILAKYVELFL
jgi:hypothetical protein